MAGYTEPLEAVFQELVSNGPGAMIRVTYWIVTAV